MITYTQLAARLALLTVATALLAGELRAQEPAPGPRAAPCADPLDAVVREALRNDLGLEQERLAEQRAAAGVREARAGFLPSLSLESRYSEQSGVLDLGDFVNPAYAALNDLTGSARFPTDVEVTLPYRFESRARLVQPVFDERVRASHAFARHELEGQRWQRRAAARALAGDVQIAYLTVAAARSSARIYEAALALVEENERVAQRLVEAGSATPDAVFRARAERSDVEQRLAETRRDVDAAARSLNRLIGRRLDAAVADVPHEALCLELPAGEDEAVESGLSRREELARVEAGAESAEAAARFARAPLVPSLSLVVDYGVQGNDPGFGSDRDFLVGSLVLSWNPFSGGRQGARRQAAQLDADRARVRRRELAELIELEVRQAFDDAVVARDAISTAEDRRIAARRTFELVRRRYVEGVASQVEFLDARTSLTNAELNHTLTTYRYAMRLVELRRAAALRRLDDTGDGKGNDL